MNTPHSPSLANDEESPSVRFANDGCKEGSSATRPASTSAASSPRYRSIDVFRGMAIINMVLIHFVEKLSARQDNPKFYDAIMHSTGFVVAPSFTFLVGLSLHLSWEKQVSRGSTSLDIAQRTIKRGIAIFVIGLVFAVVMWGFYDIFEWDILPLIGASIVIVQALDLLLPSAWTSVIFVSLAITILLIAPFMREWMNFDDHWQNEFYMYEYDFTFQDIVSGLIANGYFPLFPWLVFPLSGIVVGKHLQRVKEWTIVPGLAIVLMLLAFGLTRVKTDDEDDFEPYIGPLTFYPASTTMVLGVLGFVLLTFWVLFRLLDYTDNHCCNESNDLAATPASDGNQEQHESKTKKASTAMFVFLQRYSRFSLTVYVLHFAVCMWPLFIAASIQDQHAYYYWKDAFSPPLAFALGIVFIVLCYGLLWWWEKRNNGKYSMEWLLSQVTK